MDVQNFNSPRKFGQWHLALQQLFPSPRRFQQFLQRARLLQSLLRRLVTCGFRAVAGLSDSTRGFLNTGSWVQGLKKRAGVKLGKSRKTSKNYCCFNWESCPILHRSDVKPGSKKPDSIFGPPKKSDQILQTTVAITWICLRNT